MNYMQTSGIANGRKNDCSATALANCLQLSYQDAFDLVSNYGLKSSGINCTDYARLLLDEGFTARVYGRGTAAYWINRLHPENDIVRHAKQFTIASLLRMAEFHNGRYIIGVHRHVFALCNGCIMQNGIINLNQRVSQIYTYNF